MHDFSVTVPGKIGYRQPSRPVSHRRLPRWARPVLEPLEAREVMSVGFTSTLGGAIAKFTLQDGTLLETVHHQTKVAATGVQGVYEAKASRKREVVYASMSGNLSEFNPRSGFMPVTAASQVLGDRFGNLYALNGSTFLKVQGAGAITVATGVTRAAADSSGEIILLEGAHDYRYLTSSNGNSGKTGRSPSIQYAIDSDGNLYSLQGDTLSESASSTSASKPILTGVTQMAMDDTGEVVTLEGPHSYRYFDGVIGEIGSSPSDVFRLADSGLLYTVQASVVSVATSSTSAATAIGSNAVVASDGSIWFLGQSTADSSGERLIENLSDGQLAPVALTTEAIGGTWLSLGGPTSNLGMPTSAVVAAVDASGNSSDVVQIFAGGAIYAPVSGSTQVWYTATSSGFGITGSTPFTISSVDIDEKQGDDCAFLASLASVALADPSLLYSHIKQDNTDPRGNWDVILYIDNSWKTYRVAIGYLTSADPSPAPIPGQTAYSPNNNSVAYTTQNMWVIAFQRAYWAALNVTDVTDPSTSYESWRDPAVAMETLTGDPPGQFSWTLGQTPSSFDINTLQFLLSDQTLQEAVTVDCPTSSANERIDGTQTLVGSHEYSVVGAFPGEAGQQSVVLLRNPWGQDPDGSQTDAATYNPDGGYITVTWTQFINNFDWVYFSPTVS